MLRERHEQLPAFELRAEVVGGQFMGFVEDDQIPAGVDELVLQCIVAGHLIQPHDEHVVVLEDVAARRVLVELRREDVENQTEFVGQFVLPLLDEAARGDDQDAPRVGSWEVRWVEKAVEWL
jgi:hypothetical protein